MLSVAPTVAPSAAHGSDRSEVPFVLIVDDHEPTLERLKVLVEQSGYPCVASDSAAEALIYCDQNRPALVITDLSMPRLNGDGLARWLKARYPTTPILLITGDLLSPQVVHSHKQNFIAVIQKPLEVEPFLSLLADLMKL